MEPGPIARVDGDRGRKDDGGNSQQTTRVEMNIYGRDLHETDKNERTQKTVAEVHQNSLEIVIVFLNRVIIFKKCPVFFQNWGGWDGIGTEGKRGPPHKTG